MKRSLWIRLAVVVILVFSLSAVLTYSAVQSLIRYEPTQEIRLTVSPDYNVTTEKAVSIWPAGTVLEQGMAAYYYAARPRVDMTPMIVINGLTSGQVDGTIRTRVMLQAINDKAQVYWKSTLSDKPEQSFLLRGGVSGQRDHLSFSASDIRLNTAGAYNSVTEIGKELMFQTGVFQLVVVSDIHVIGTANGFDVDKRFSFTFPITLQQSSFTVPTTQDASVHTVISQSGGTLTGQDILAEVIRSRLVLFIADIVLILLLVVLLVQTRKKKSKESIEHKRFKEWITEGHIEVKGKLSIYIHSLEGLVDLAIDLDKRVIYDAGVKRYFVLAEDILYEHDPARSAGRIGKKQQLGKLLLERGQILPEQLETALYYHQRIGSRLGESLIALGFIDETTLYSTIAAQQKINYIELDPETETDIAQLEKMTIRQARALQAVPLGARADGRLVIACSEISKEGIRDTLKEMFGSEILLVAARPSSIHAVLARLEFKSMDKPAVLAKHDESEKTRPYQRLTVKQCEQFITSYMRGVIPHDLFLQAAGLVDSNILAQAPKHEQLTVWLSNRHIIGGEIANLMNGLDRIVENMDWKTRRGKKLPPITELLQKANYLTAEMADWVDRELVRQKMPLDRLLSQNYLVSEKTLKNAMRLLDTLHSLLNKS